MSVVLQSSAYDVKSWLASWKDAAQTVSYVGALIAAGLAWWTYHTNSQRERAKWAVQLYEKFYEEKSYRDMRDALDCDAASPDIEKLVHEEKPEFTDYLNFFELVCFLGKTNQISESDVLTLFEYYLRCLKRHPSVIRYINKPDHGFEQLREFLRTIPL